jgi:hypothetical protein
VATFRSAHEVNREPPRGRLTFAGTIRRVIRLAFCQIDPKLRRSDDTSNRPRCNLMADTWPAPLSPSHAPAKRRAADAAAMKSSANDSP